MTDTIDPTPTANPADELGHRRRVAALAVDIADLTKDLIERVREYRELGVPAREWLDLVANAMASWPSPVPSRLIEWVSPYISTVIDLALAYGSGLPLDEITQEATRIGMSAAGLSQREPDDEVDDEYDRPPLLSVIKRLFDEAAAERGGDPDQAPALEVHLLLRGAPMQFSGILSTTPEGTLRLMTPVDTPGQAPIMIEQFFEYKDVTSVAIVRKVTVESSRIIT